MSELPTGADSIPTDRTAINLATRESDTEPRLTLAATSTLAVLAQRPLGSNVRRYLLALAVVDLRGVVATTAFVSGLIAQPVAVLLLHAVRPQKRMRATATLDGSAVIVTDPHPAFAAAVRELQR